MNNKQNTIPQPVGLRVKNPTGWDKNLAGKNRFRTYAGMTGKNRFAAADNVSPDPKGSSLKPLESWGKNGVGKISTRRVGKRGFTLIEVLVTIVVSSILFIAISNLMASFFRINADIKNTIAINNEKETVHMTLQNFLDEAWRVVLHDPVSTPGLDTIVLLNKKDSKLLPFTIITTEQMVRKEGSNNVNAYYGDASTPTTTPIKHLLIKNVAYTCTANCNQQPTSQTWTLQDRMIPRVVKDTATSLYYVSDYWKNAVYKYATQPNGDHFCGDTGTTTDCITKPTGDAYCGQTPEPSPCILAGYKQNQLVPGTTAFAPFIKILKPTDMKVETGYLYVLAPYESTQYKIKLNDFSITTTDISDIATYGKFFYTYSKPYFIDINLTTFVWELQKDIKNFTKQNKLCVSGKCYVVLIPLTNIPPSANDIKNSFGVISLKFIRSIYGTPVLDSSKDSIDQIQYTLVDPMYTKDGKSGNNDPVGNTTKQSSSFLFKTSKIN
jgi:prepilin-type N-terminal cleavage/methylation domain-containing protein